MTLLDETVHPSIAALPGGVAVAVVVSAALGRWVGDTRRPGDSGAGSSRARQRRGDGAQGRFGRRRAVRPLRPEAGATWLDDVARATRSGVGLAEAVATTAWPTTGDRRRGHARDAAEALRRSTRRGAGVAEAVERWPATTTDDTARTVATALVVADEVGGSVAVPLERAAVALRARAADDDERSGWAAQAILSARVLALLPLGFLTLLAVSDRDVVDAVTSPVGATVVAVGLGLDALGFWWMHLIVRRVGR